MLSAVQLGLVFMLAARLCWQKNRMVLLNCLLSCGEIVNRTITATRPLLTLQSEGSGCAEEPRTVDRAEALTQCARPSATRAILLVGHPTWRYQPPNKCVWHPRSHVR